MQTTPDQCQASSAKPLTTLCLFETMNIYEPFWSCWVGMKHGYTMIYHDTPLTSYQSQARPPPPVANLKHIDRPHLDSCLRQVVVMVSGQKFWRSSEANGEWQVVLSTVSSMLLGAKYLLFEVFCQAQKRSYHTVIIVSYTIDGTIPLTLLLQSKVSISHSKHGHSKSCLEWMAYCDRQRRSATSA